MMNRRSFLGSTAAAFASLPLVAAGDPAEPILDIHQHALYSGQSDQQFLVHQKQNGITLTNLLPGDGWLLALVGGNAYCAALQGRYPDQFLRFACADPIEGETYDTGGTALPAMDPNLPVLKPVGRNGWASATAKLRAFGVGKGGRQNALGIGEMKFHVQIDSPEMDRIYKLAEKVRCPVLLHFQYQSYNMGSTNLPKVLKAYPHAVFIGHAQTWWAHISADCDPRNMYPTGPIKPGGLTDRLLRDHPNLYADLSGNSGLNALTRDPDFTPGFLKRHSHKLLFGSDCACRDGRGGGSPDGYCIAQRCLAALRKFAPDPALLRRILYQNSAGILHL